MWVAKIAQLSSFSWQTSVPRWQMFFSSLSSRFFTNVFSYIIIKILYHLIVFIRWHWTPYRFWEEMATWMTILQVLNIIIFLFVVIMINLSFNDFPAGIKHYSIITANIIKNIIMILLRDAYPFQNGWIFGKVPNGLWPPPSFSESYVAIFLNWLRSLQISWSNSSL